MSWETRIEKGFNELQASKKDSGSSDRFTFHQGALFMKDYIINYLKLYHAIPIRLRDGSGNKVNVYELSENDLSNISKGDLKKKE